VLDQKQDSDDVFEENEAKSMKFPVFSHLTGNLGLGDGFARDCPLQQRVCEPSVPQLQRPTGRRLEERTDDQCSVDLHGELADAAVTDQLLGVRGRPGRLRGVGAAVGLAAGGTHAFGLRPRPSAFAIVERRSE